MYKDNPGGEYYQRTIDNSSFGAAQRRPSILQRQATHEGAFPLKNRVNHVNSEPSATSSSTATTSKSPAPHKTGRFDVVNVDETKI